MIEYCVYYRDESVIMGEKPFTWMIGKFTQENYAILFLKTLQKEQSSKNVTYFMDKWDTEKNAFIR